MKRDHWDDDDALYDSIHQGDRSCKVCGKPSWAMAWGDVVCKQHYDARKEAEKQWGVKNDKQ